VDSPLGFARLRRDRSTLANACISGTGYYVPPRIVTNDQLREDCGIDTTDE